MSELKIEKKLLTISLWVTAAFALLSFVLGVLFHSQVIVFDGLYSLIGVGMSYFSLYAVSFIGKEDWRSFPFGKDIIEPLVVTINYFVILLLVAGSIISAVFTVLGRKAHGFQSWDESPFFYKLSCSAKKKHIQ
ncbi:cation transporter [Natranaerofaba carboxydovora]|uniref:cation transporter n=1 Tax=Natranaerofaba carboxydovora TaxID=2742683 RepID=UPI001F1430EC|nr:cation transporter [Natranaerofaba carboxydovora]UMZ74385.1 Cation efflux family protein [Natranaerofaba carboxydovora]